MGPKKDASKMEKHVFRIYDSNNDGYIDFIEFMVIFHIMSDGSPEEVLEKIFRVFDVNSDGTINKKEMSRLIKDMYGLIKAEDPEAQSKELIAKNASPRWTKMPMGKSPRLNSSRRVFLRSRSARCSLSKSLTSSWKRTESSLKIILLFLYYI